MSSKRRTQRFTSILMTIGVAALAAPGCHRQLSVKGGDFEPDAGWTGTGGASGSGSPGGVLDGIEQGSGGAPVVGTGGSAVGAGGVGEEAGTGGTPVPTGEASGGGGDAAGSGVVTGGVGG
ncbi:MAG TPA: hypothetical protein VHU40_16360, partial [Polyangia bacterium]|nr:hypothetical protein [Polyangia bacterium]